MSFSKYFKKEKPSMMITNFLKNRIDVSISRDILLYDIIKGICKLIFKWTSFEPHTHPKTPEAVKGKEMICLQKPRKSNTTILKP